MIVCSFIGYLNGDPWKLIAPIDGNNKICGFSEGYEDYDHLYIDDITTALDPANVWNVFSYGVCVKACPKEKTDNIECKPTTSVTNCNPPVAD